VIARRTWPNLVSLTRLPLATGFLLSTEPMVRVALLAAAGLSDSLDGRLARALGQDTRTGAILDPIADKIFALTVLLVFLSEGRIQGWELAVLLSRDVATTAAFAVILLLRMPIRFRSRYPGKAVTVLQVFTMLALTLESTLARPLVLLTGLASIAAIADYANAAATSPRGRPGPAA
jgi:cardiolipin synthase